MSSSIRPSSARTSRSRRSRWFVAISCAAAAAVTASATERARISAWAVKWSRRVRWTSRSRSRERLPARCRTSSACRRTACFASARRRCRARLRSSRIVLEPSSTPAPTENGLISASPDNVVTIPTISTPPYDPRIPTTIPFANPMRSSSGTSMPGTSGSSARTTIPPGIVCSTGLSGSGPSPRSSAGAPGTPGSRPRTSSPDSAKWSATRSASHQVRSPAHTNVVATASPISSVSHGAKVSHAAPGSAASRASSAARTTWRIRSRRSQSMSETRSETPSARVCCQRALRSLSSAARSRAVERSAATSRARSGSSSPTRSVSSAAPISATAWATWSRTPTARPAPAGSATRSRNRSASAGTPDSTATASAPGSPRSRRRRACACSVAETGTTSTSRPCAARWRRSRSRTSRHRGCRSTLVRATTTVPHCSAAARIRAISGAVSSREASLTTTTACASGKPARTASPRAERGPLSPGVSTRTRPSAGRPSGTVTSAAVQAVPGSGGRSPVTARARSAAPTGRRTSSPSDALPTSVAVVSVPWRTTVGSRVATSSWTGQIGVPTSSPTSALFPCLKSPTTSTRAPVSASRSRAAAREATRSGRP